MTLSTALCCLSRTYELPMFVYKDQLIVAGTERPVQKDLGHRSYEEWNFCGSTRERGGFKSIRLLTDGDRRIPVAITLPGVCDKLHLIGNCLLSICPALDHSLVAVNVETKTVLRCPRTRLSAVAFRAGKYDLTLSAAGIVCICYEYNGQKYRKEEQLPQEFVETLRGIEPLASRLMLFLSGKCAKNEMAQKNCNQ
ncbi:hypothetical protein PFISCL1PPCAC_28847 [Pristionchus fissidentatus]|uniref:Uncharacterized protein n=1 Tax=Pristionchus fissidentatus TaxID=1538716 RepID=A0AAV5X1C3_9BILA|nr:hypothetical protein PFISCL1PPCAC_28847 [Pristionchus fissidentatus]